MSDLLGLLTTVPLCLDSVATDVVEDVLFGEADYPADLAPTNGAAVAEPVDCLLRDAETLCGFLAIH